MARIAQKDKDQIAKVGAQLQRDVAIDFFTQRESPIYVPGVVPCETCTTTEEVLAEIEPLIPRLKVRTHDIVAEAELAKARGVTRVPTLTFGDGVGERVRFMGAPLGYEFSTFLSGVLEAGGASKVVSDGALAKLATISEPVSLKVFVTPT